MKQKQLYQTINSKHEYNSQTKQQLKHKIGQTKIKKRKGFVVLESGVVLASLS